MSNKQAHILDDEIAVMVSREDYDRLMSAFQWLSDNPHAHPANVRTIFLNLYADLSDYQK